MKLRKNNWDSDTYEFDEVFTEFASQKRVYEVVAKPVVEVCHVVTFPQYFSELSIFAILSVFYVREHHF